MTDDRHEQMLDAAIDDVARELTAGAPRADLRARVVARIAAREPRRLPRRLAWAVPLAAAALVLVAFGVFRHDGAQRPKDGDRARGPVQTAPEGAPSDRAPGVVAHRDDAPPVRDLVPRRAESRPPLQRPSAIDALASPPLIVERLGVAALESMDSIQLSEMTVPAIDVAPLTIDDRPR